MTSRLLPLFLLASPALCQVPAVSVPARTSLTVVLDRNYPLRIGTPIEGHLLYPIHVDSALVLPKGALALGTVERLQPDRTRRTHAMLGGDFTPFRTPVVRFTALKLASGVSVPLVTTPASAGAPVYRVVAPQRTQGGIVHQQLKAGLNAARSDLAYFIAPGKGDRLLDWIYSQLPYHPQRIAKETAWTVELTAPIEVPSHPEAPSPTRPLAARGFGRSSRRPRNSPSPALGASRPISRTTSALRTRHAARAFAPLWSGRSSTPTRP